MMIAGAFFLLVVASTVQAQPPGFDQPIFQTDTLNPTQGGAAKLLEAVCPGQFIVGETITCQGGCAKFPWPVDRDAPGGWNVTGVLHGHFLDKETDDILLGTEGCEDHADQGGGSILIPDRKSPHPKPIYYGGLISTHCHKIRATDGRDLLVCETTDGHQSYLSREITLIDVLAPKPHWQSTIFAAVDSVNACGGRYAGTDPPDPVVVRAYIERVVFTATGMTIFARHGSLKLTPAQLANCAHPETFPPIATQLYKLEFQFDGKTFRVASSSQTALKIFKN